MEVAAQAIVAAIPEPARQAIRFPDGDFEETDEGFAAAFYAEFSPAQAAAVRRAIGLMSGAPAPRAAPGRPGLRKTAGHDGSHREPPLPRAGAVPTCCAESASDPRARLAMELAMAVPVVFLVTRLITAYRGCLVLRPVASQAACYAVAVDLVSLPRCSGSWSTPACGCAR